MSENPLQSLLQAFQNVSQSVQSHLSQFLALPHLPPPTNGHPFGSIFRAPILNLSPDSKPDPSLLQPKDILTKPNTGPVSKEELGRATWTFLHTLAAQYPDNPTRQQKKDVRELMAILSRIYPCKQCADHFKDVLNANPVRAGSHAEFSQWLCHVHNVVNRSLGKLVFPCERVDVRWGNMECEKRECDLQVDHGGPKDV